MPERFSRLLEANRNAEAYQRFRTWRDNAGNRPRNPGSGRARGQTIEVGITPFGFDLPASTVVRSSCTADARREMGTAIGAHGVTTLTGLTVQRIPGFKAARVVMFVGTGGTSTPTSQITGLPYLRYAGRSYSHPFGSATGTDLEYEVFTDLRTALLATNRRVSYQPEKRQVIA